VTIERVQQPYGEREQSSDISSAASVTSHHSVKMEDRSVTTPNTSVSVTPAASVKGVNLGKRKRTRLSNGSDIEMIDAAEDLAEAPQPQEHRRPMSKRRRFDNYKQEIPDSDDHPSAVDLTNTGASWSREEALAEARLGKRASTGPAMKRNKAIRDELSLLSDPRAYGLEAFSDSDSVLSEADSVADSDAESEASYHESDAESEEGSKAVKGPPSVKADKRRSARRVDDSDDEEAESVSRPTKKEKQHRKPNRSSRSTKKSSRVKAAPEQASQAQEDEEDENDELNLGVPQKDIDDMVTEMYTTRQARERQKLERSHPEIITMWKDLEKIPIIPPEAAPQPESINRKLKTFQLEGLNWMIKQEKTHYKGGLLGDEMGMGKTIQAVSLIMSDYPAKQPTLVMVPPVALMQWSNEIKDYTHDKLKVLIYHGQNSQVKKMKVKDLKQYDVILISYNSLESLYRKQTKGWTRGEDLVKESSPIHAIHFHRLILDEAHSIKSRTTGSAKACFALKSSYKWCLSGTPVQNRIGEFFSLLRFLEVRPYADYFCKRCPCKMLHWSVDEEHRCTTCKHSSIEHVSVFNQELLNPLTQSESAADRSAAMAKLHLITGRIMLRRMKKDYVSSMELPPKEVTIHREFFSEVERDFSSSIMSNTVRQFNTYVHQNVVLNNVANIFGLIMKLRQVSYLSSLLMLIRKLRLIFRLPIIPICY